MGRANGASRSDRRLVDRCPLAVLRWSLIVVRSPLSVIVLVERSTRSTHNGQRSTANDQRATSQRPTASLRELLQRAAQQRGELGVIAELFACRVERGVGILRPVAEVHKGGGNVIVDRRARRRGGRRSRLGEGQLVAQLEAH